MSWIRLRVYRSRPYRAWFRNLDIKTQRIIDARIDIARRDGILIKHKLLDQETSLYEFKWDSGLRVYFSLLQDKDGNFLLLLQGGNKNSQKENIGSAKNVILKAVRSILGKKKKIEEK
ncbi:MAG: hypothetical protein A2X86_09980 [Bdellovibrionales bacterium GWA2_49_15]|nr:MAG: hypothetical protein A2X86_09980 [Bdellovibrionales bacterium GWA2_49_15]HAZ13112.1 hypothetical protein [Bdellovibrionales bacterium]